MKWRRKKSFNSSKHRAMVLAKKLLPRSYDEYEPERERRESDAGYETASEKVGAAFLQIGGKSFNADYYGRIPGNNNYQSTTPATFYNSKQAKALESTYKPSSSTTTTTTAAPTKKCYTTPKRDCRKVTKKQCKQVSDVNTLDHKYFSMS